MKHWLLHGGKFFLLLQNRLFIWSFNDRLRLIRFCHRLRLMSFCFLGRSHEGGRLLNYALKHARKACQVSRLVFVRFFGLGWLAFNISRLVFLNGFLCDLLYRFRRNFFRCACLTSTASHSFKLSLLHFSQDECEVITLGQKFGQVCPAFNNVIEIFESLLVHRKALPEYNAPVKATADQAPPKFGLFQLSLVRLRLMLVCLCYECKNKIDFKV